MDELRQTVLTLTGSTKSQLEVCQGINREDRQEKKKKNPREKSAQETEEKIKLNGGIPVA